MARCLTKRRSVAARCLSMQRKYACAGVPGPVRAGFAQPRVRAVRSVGCVASERTSRGRRRVGAWRPAGSVVVLLPGIGRNTSVPSWRCRFAGMSWSPSTISRLLASAVLLRWPPPLRERHSFRTNVSSRVVGRSSAQIEFRAMVLGSGVVCSSVGRIGIVSEACSISVRSVCSGERIEQELCHRRLGGGQSFPSCRLCRA